MARGAVGSDASSRHRASGLRPLRFRMSIGLRRAIYVLCALLWVSGCAWLVVHFAFPTATDFGPAPNPFEPLLLRMHGWGAVCGFGAALAATALLLEAATARRASGDAR